MSIRYPHPYFIGLTSSITGGLTKGKSLFLVEGWNGWDMGGFPSQQIAFEISVVFKILNQGL